MINLKSQFKINLSINVNNFFLLLLWLLLFFLFQFANIFILVCFNNNNILFIITTMIVFFFRFRTMRMADIGIESLCFVTRAWFGCFIFCSRTWFRNWLLIYIRLWFWFRKVPYFCFLFFLECFWRCVGVVCCVVVLFGVYVSIVCIPKYKQNKIPQIIVASPILNPKWINGKAIEFCWNGINKMLKMTLIQ